MERYAVKNQKTLRCGITTGTCATAAAKAAAELLLLGVREETVSVQTPKGIRISVPVQLSLESDRKCQYMVIKDSGDDPDVTNHAQIYVSVEFFNESEPAACGLFRDELEAGLFLDGGKGIGRVTKEGLEVKPGLAAINAVPRSMIFAAVREVMALAECSRSLLVTVSVPNGEELAERTFNPRLGIIGGISILGTSGIIEPMSEKAIVDTIETQIRQLRALGADTLLVTPGNYGQGYAARCLGLDLSQSIKCSNYVGETLDLAVAYGMKAVLLVGNIGKLVKLAAGIMNTHSRTADARCEILAVHTVLCGGEAWMVHRIMDCINTEQILGLLEQWGLKEEVMKSLCRRMTAHVNHRIGPSMRAGVILFSEEYGMLGMTEDASQLLEEFRQEQAIDS